MKFEYTLVILLTLQLACMVFLIVMQFKVFDYVMSIQPKSVTIVAVDKADVPEILTGEK